MLEALGSERLSLESSPSMGLEVGLELGCSPEMGKEGLLQGSRGPLSLRTGRENFPQSRQCPACGPQQIDGCKVTWVSWQHGIKLDCTRMCTHGSRYLHGSTEHYIAIHRHILHTYT